MRYKWRSKVIETDRQVMVVLGLSRHTFVCLPKMINEEPALWHYLEGKMSSLKGNEVDIDERSHSQENPQENDIRYLEQ